MDLPEDISNKKYLSTKPIVINERPVVSPKVQESSVTPIPVQQPFKAVPEKTRRKKYLTKENLNRFKKYLTKKWNYFKEVQYPELYSKFYDLYNFDLVTYKPLDLALKILILLTLLILLFIIGLIIIESVRLVF